MRTAVIALIALSLGCVESPTVGAEASREIANMDCAQQAIPWGDEPADLGFQSGGLESAARGPHAISLVDSQTVAILDNVGSRVMRLSWGAGLEVWVEEVERTAEEMSAGPSGEVAVYSPVKHAVKLYGRDGEPLGTVPVPRALRHTARIELGSSRRMYAYSALQERHLLGSPLAPMALESVLRSRVEGAWHEDGLGVVAIVTDGRGELRYLRSPVGERAQLSKTVSLPGPLDAAQVIAATNDLVCVRTENIDSDSSVVSVERRLLCVDSPSGRMLVDKVLPPVGPYLPRREIAVRRTGNEIVIAHAQPMASELVISRCEVRQ